MCRIVNDKYYTEPSLANYCWEKTVSVIGKDHISRVIEPSVGSGAFLEYPQHKVNVAYDIAPECVSTEDTEVIQADFLTIPDTHIKGQLIIGNPPFGHSGTLAHKFYKKATKLADYISFILPISQLNNYQNYYEFDLVYSEDLGIHSYSGRMLHCCLNIYKRPVNGGTNHKPPDNSDLITIYRNDTKDYDACEYDIRMCYWGSNSGKILTDSESYGAEYKIKINNPKYKKSIITLLSSYPWEKELKSIAQKSIPQYKIHNIIRQYIIMKKNNSKETVKGGVANATSSKKLNKADMEKAFSELAGKYSSYLDFSKTTAENQWDGQELDPNRRYHLKDMGGLPILENDDNRRTIKRAWEMLGACSDTGMTTPAVLVKAQLLADWGMHLVDPLTREPATPEQIAESYAILEGHGRHFGWLLGYALNGTSPFDFNFVSNDYTAPEKVGRAYISTNKDMTRTTNKDRLVIAGARSENPLVKLCNKRINEDGCIAKAAYFWTFGRELSIDEASKYVKGDADAPTFNQTLVEARNEVYEGFKIKFSSEKGREIYGGAPAAKWVAGMLSAPGTADVASEKICSKLESMSNDLYDTIITAKTSKAKKTKREDVIINALNDMMA